MNSKLLAAVAVVALTMCALGGIVLASDESDAAGDVYFTPSTNTNYTNQGTSANPITDLTKALPSSSSSSTPSSNVAAGATLDGLYVVVGAPVDITFGYNAQMRIAATVTEISSGFGVSLNQSSTSVPSDWGASFTTLYEVQGTFSKAGNFTLDYSTFQGTSGSSGTATIHVVESEDGIDFTSPAAVSGISGGSISYTAQTNIDATFSESGGTGASWLSVNSSTGKVTGTFPTVSSMTSYTYIIKATSETNSSNTATQTITINVYPVAKITATSTSVSGTEGEAITSITLSGNLDMSFSKSSGSFPAGVNLSSSGTISGTPTSTGSFTAVIKGTVTEGPSQFPTITIRFNIEASEKDLVISIDEPAESYKVGQSITLDLESNVDGTTWEVSGTAASFMSVSGNSVVGSVPSTYVDVTTVTLTVTAETPNGQTGSDTVSFSVEPVLSFTSVPTVSCVINPVYDYNEDGTPVISSSLSLFSEVYAADEDSFIFDDTLTICATFTGENADTVTWFWGDGTSDTGNKVQHTYEEPGTYEIRLVASNEVGESEMTITITVGDNGVSILTMAIIVILIVVVIYLVYRLAVSGRRRGH